MNNESKQPTDEEIQEMYNYYVKEYESNGNSSDK